MRDFQDESKKKDIPPKRRSSIVKPKVRQGGRGKPLEPGLKSVMGSALGSHVDEVSVHTGPRAEEAARELGARAFTVGKDIYFAEGEYSPSTQQGRRLLAHEITHVVQQREDQKEVQPSARENIEKEAEIAAQILSKGEGTLIREKSPSGTLLMKEEEKKAVPTVTRHKGEIVPTPPGGRISGPGYSIGYLYNIVKGADFVTLNLNIPQGIGVEVTPITALGSGDYRVQGSGGMDARTVIISVSAHLKGMPKVQVSFAKGGSSYIVVFQFPPAAENE